VIDPLLPVASGRSVATKNDAPRGYLLRRLFTSGFENVYQKSAAPIPKSSEHRRDIEIPQAMVSVPSDRIVSIAHNDSGVAQRIWIRTRCPFSDELHHLKNLFRSIPIPGLYATLSGDSRVAALGYSLASLSCLE